MRFHRRDFDDRHGFGRRDFGHHRHGFRRGFRILGLLMAVGGAGFLAAGCHRSPEERMSMVSEKIADRLEFNDQQKALLNDIVADMKKDFAEAKARRESMKGEFTAMLMAQDLDKAKIKGLIKERQERMDVLSDKYIDKIAAPCLH